MLSCSNAVVYTYDLALGCFTKLADRWWAEGSDAWGWNKQRSAAGTGGGGGGTGGGPKGLEGYCNNIPVESPTTATSVNASNANAGSAVASGDNDNGDDGGEGEERTKKPQWWTEALTLGHLETRMYAAKTLDSPVEYKQALLTYARRVADEGFRWKAEELIRELFGPVYWCVSFISLSSVFPG
jgi:protein HIRA/HIR1